MTLEGDNEHLVHSSAALLPCMAGCIGAGTGSSGMSLPRLPFQVELGLRAVPQAARVVEREELCQ